MTGFGAGEAPLSGGVLTIEIRALNHRYLDLRVRAPSADLVHSVELLARERLVRGRFDVSVRFDGGALGGVTLDRERARSAFRALAELRDELAPGADVPLSILAAVPDLFTPAASAGGAEAITAAFDRAKAALDEMREREGVALADDLKKRLATVRELCAGIAARSPLVVDAYRTKLTERAAALATKVAFEPGRLEQEIALFADKIDIAEEVTRLSTHTAHFEQVLAGDGVGRRLDFLLQEMGREVNTIGAKSQDVAIAHAVVDLKAEIERMREQVQNVE
jgi:uncharacterized protein (TIGR00255 family)